MKKFLGRSVLKKIQSRKKRKKKFSGPSAASAPGGVRSNNRGVLRGIFPAQEKSEAGRHKKSLPVVVPVEVPRALAPPVPLRSEIILTQAPVLRYFTVQTFLQPSEAVASSLEGFFLNQRSDDTRRSYRNDLKRWIKFLLEWRMRRGDREIDRTMILAYRESLLGQGLEATTCDRYLASLKSLFQWFLGEGLIEKDPTLQIRFLSPKRISRTQGFTDEDVRRVLDLPDLHSRAGVQHYCILMFLFYLGLRRSELTSLRCNSFFEERGMMVLRIRGKGNRERLIPLPEGVKNALRLQLRMSRKEPNEDRHLFTPVKNNLTGQMEKALDGSSIFAIVQKYSKKAGIQYRVSPHSCRATAISNARDREVPDRAIQEFAGWASPDMIVRYDKRKTSLEKSAAHAIEYGAADRTPPAGGSAFAPTDENSDDATEKKTTAQQLPASPRDEGSVESSGGLS